ncbi:MAG: hypothetical protein PVG84_16140 [Desulfobacterales bacterium]|jgi:hypothetical protein
MTQTYPDDCVQGIIEPEKSWWVECEGHENRRGRLVWAFIPHVGQMPCTLIPVERGDDPTQHKVAKVRIEPTDIKSLVRYPKLPIPSLPHRKNEVRTVYLAKKRPALIISGGGPWIQKELIKDKPNWQTYPSVIVAPYYGAGESGYRSGYNPVFMTRVRHCEYPQFVWDKLPIGSGPKESIMRLDHMQPIPRNQNSIEFTSHCLRESALLILDEWIEWLITGNLEKDGSLCETRDFLFDFS